MFTLREGPRERTYPAVMESDNIFSASNLLLQHLYSRRGKYLRSGESNCVQFMIRLYVYTSLDLTKI